MHYGQDEGTRIPPWVTPNPFSGFRAYGQDPASMAAGIGAESGASGRSPIMNGVLIGVTVFTITRIIDRVLFGGRR